jgi:tetratricopeptide (TPR) repeat protein
MKHTISLWMGLLAFAFLPALAQTPALTGKIHGHVTGPEGTTKTAGTVSLSTDGGRTAKFTFPVSASGDFAGPAAPGTYTLVYRSPETTPPNGVVDLFEGIKIVAGQDILQDDDMTRKQYLDKLTPEQKKQLEEVKKRNAEALKTNQVVNNINADIKTSNQDIKDAEGAHATAIQVLGDKAAKADIDAKVAEIQLAKYTEIETLMLKDTTQRPNEPALLTLLAQAQLKLKKYDEAAANYKMVLELEAASKKPHIESQGAANAGLGEIYARTGKVAEAEAAYDAAAKINPTFAAIYLKNEAVVFYQEHNSDAQAFAADKATQADPNLAVAYYLKGDGLIKKASADLKTGRYTAPPGCLEAYQKYLELDSEGPYAGDVRDILNGFGQKIESTYKAKPSKK